MRAAFLQAQGGSGDDPESEFDTLLSQSFEALSLIGDRLEEYGADPAQLWRLIWVLHLCQSLDAQMTSMKDTAPGAKISTALDRIRASQDVDPVARLWAMEAKTDRTPEETVKLIEQIHGLDYRNAGRIWHGL